VKVNRRLDCRCSPHPAGTTQSFRYILDPALEGIHHRLFDEGGGEGFGGFVEALYGGFERVWQTGTEGFSHADGGGFDLAPLFG
jgi:hypothetical protein